MRGLSPVAASGGHSSSQCADLSLSRPLLLRSTGSRRAGSVVVAHGLSCSAACGIFPDQGSNPCPLHWQADSLTTAPPGKPPRLCIFRRALDSQEKGEAGTQVSHLFPAPHMHSSLPITNIPHQGGTCVTADEPALTHHYHHGLHYSSLVVLSSPWIWAKYDDVYPPL